MLSSGYRLFRKAVDPLYRGLGLGFFLAVCSCAVANLFGDRWTYLEINGLLWVLAACVARAQQLSDAAHDGENLSLSPSTVAPWEARASLPDFGTR